MVVRICGPVAKVVREVADYLNGPEASVPKAIEGPDVTFLITDEPLDATLAMHEMQHSRQAERLEPRWIPDVGPLSWLRETIGWSRFYAAYAVEYARVGYWDNKYEREARLASGEER